jgi:hypothetical protein
LWKTSHDKKRDLTIKMIKDETKSLFVATEESKWYETRAEHRHQLSHAEIVTYSTNFLRALHKPTSHLQNVANHARWRRVNCTNR